MGQDDTANWNRLLRYDSQDMLGDLAAFPAQCREAIRLAEEADLPEPPGELGAVLAVGLGGSAIGGDMLAALLESQAPVPVLVHRDYGLPAWVGPGTLVLAVSYSGNTEETLDAYRTAVERGATVIAVTSGGTLRRLAEKAAAAGRPVGAIIIPSGLQPRAATGYLFLPMLVAAHRLGLTGLETLPLHATLTAVDGLAAALAWDANENPARRLAAAMVGRPLFIYGAGAVGGVAAYRWQTQLNENAKVLAHAHRIPELNHNEIVGWQGVPAPDGQVLHGGRPLLIALRHGSEHPRNALRMAITQEVLRHQVECRQVVVETQQPLAALLGLMCWGDMVSFYLALLNDRDPSTIENIVYLKDRLAQDG